MENFAKESHELLLMMALKETSAKNAVLGSTTPVKSQIKNVTKELVLA